MIIKELCLNNIVNEVRRNPDRNPRISINQSIKSALDSTTDYLEDTKNLFVSFTSLEKLGVNPQSKDKTPIGIYSYPAEYAFEEMGEYFDPEKAMPYAGNRPWVNIFKMRGDFVDLNMSDGEVKYYYSKIQDVIKKSVNDVEYLDEALDTFKSILKNANIKARQPQIPGGKFWYVTYETSNFLSQADFFDHKWNNRPPVNWNLLFRIMGIDGIIDPGLSIIHENEPNQAVCFSRKSVHNVNRVANKYSPEKLENNEKLRVLQSGSVEEQFKLIKQNSNWLLKLKNPSEELLLKLIDTSKSHIFNILIATVQGKTNQKIQHAAVSKDPQCIQWIKNPSPEIQAMAVANRPEYISYIEDSDPEVQMMAIRANPAVFKRIKNPSEQAMDLYDQLMD